MPLIIPCRTDLDHYSMQVTLEGVIYTLVFRWNVREASWYMQIQDAQGNALCGGYKIVVGFPIAARSRVAGKPPGFFWAFDSTGEDRPPAIDELGERVRLVYFTAGEKAAL